MEYLRVTEVLSKFSGIEYIKPEVLENAAQRGTRVHKACEGIAKGLDGWDLPEEYQGYVESFKKWFNRGKDFVEIEKRLYCSELGITGQIDFIIREPDGCVIVDLKTSARESKTWLLQGSAYSYLAKKAGYDVKGILFLKVERDGSDPKLFLYNENMELFKEVLNVYKYFYGRKGKRRKKVSK